ncbi:beta-1,4-galactosyltransferase 3 isoform X1 [Octopus bimaculoides]|uniref:Beta-1,4-galactosyltransferase n=2 Tax=Octopus bimaculoides TaxID=37653 RepID=A0A0L8HDH4_OCTBM|nr:beta-1,4-galactosyltransferase 3 isoform X1 [Octopus bimaculoides]|eukprot:XP_014773202.1 PREDICTED: beta-1,4-galactosyltransferase 3-like [Octopus bimaculoides]
MVLMLRNCRKIFIKLLATIYMVLIIYSVINYNSRCRTTMPDVLDYRYLSDPIYFNKCRIDFPALGIKKIDIFSEPEINLIQEENKQVKLGGSWRPMTCDSWQKIAIVIPYRNRWKHLKILLNRLHPMLTRQKADYRIFVIEQSGISTFNRGKLMNIGYLEALDYDSFDCFVFHDVDLIPENDKNIYLCDQHARHLASAIDEMRYHVMFYNYAGGVIAINRENVKKINGYSNFYWGWGNEDDDLSARTKSAGLLLTRPPEYIGRYKMVRHVKDSRAEHGNELFLSWRSRWSADGLNDHEGMNYTVVARANRPLYTNITVNIGRSTVPKKQPTNPVQESLWWFFNFYYP